MGNKGTDDSINWTETILSTLKGATKEDTGGEASSTGSLPVKRLRRLVLLSLQIDDSDKSGKKAFKRTVQELEKEGHLNLDADGTVTLKKQKKRKVKEEKKKKKDKKDKKKKKKLNPPSEEDESQNKDEAEEDKEIVNDDSTSDAVDDKASKNKPCKGNPQGVTRLFLGNLPFAVDEAGLGAFLPGDVTHIKWITDKETGKFYGSAFCEMDNSKNAAKAVAMAGSQLMGRPVKINFAPAREGDVWPPEKKVVSGGGQAGGTGVKAMSEKPENCVKLFIGNLSYDIDDDGIKKFFDNVGAEVKAVRWLHHKDSGDFKGVGFVEFWNTEACDKAATLNGKNLLGRPIRIDWTD
mmetsp:Transcript_25235/g.38849  ORF Transcript_25235/g.38849 Transcript_25235/m.38849 type:complete len:351 (-) Transcript_25235:141-1193(-)